MDFFLEIATNPNEWGIVDDIFNLKYGGNRILPLGLLGIGETATVYEATKEGEDSNFAIKIFKPSDHNFGQTIRNEEANLNIAMKYALELGIPGYVPAFKGRSDCGRAILLTPVGVEPRYHEESITEFRRLLTKLHAEGFVLRDISPDNFIWSIDHLIFVDWNSLIRQDSQGNKYFGTYHFASQRVLTCMHKNIPFVVKEEDDMESLLKTSISLLWKRY
mgnify:CR=1 FL=1